MTAQRPPRRHLNKRFANLDPTDPLGIKSAVKRGGAAKSMGHSVQRALQGLWVINGVSEEENDASDFLLAPILGMALLAEQLHYEMVNERTARLEATVPAPVAAQARRMVKGYQYAMDDAERSIKAGRIQQLELDLLPALDLDW
jgi:hypothetical protein